MRHFEMFTFDCMYIRRVFQLHDISLSSHLLRTSSSSIQHTAVSSVRFSPAEMQSNNLPSSARVGFPASSVAKHVLGMFANRHDKSRNWLLSRFHEMLLLAFPSGNVQSLFSTHCHDTISERSKEGDGTAVRMIWIPFHQRMIWIP